jgi:cytochrome c-type biogenesis protein CcmE
MTAQLKVGLGAAVIVGATLYMAYVGASSSWQYYVTADEYLAHTTKFTGQRLRVSGKVADGSLEVSAPRTRAQFALGGIRGRLLVECTGSIPDNLAEGSEVVVEGLVDARGVLRGDKVLTKCASKYETDSAATPPIAARPREVL